MKWSTRVQQLYTERYTGLQEPDEEGGAPGDVHLDKACTQASSSARSWRYGNEDGNLGLKGGFFGFCNTCWDGDHPGMRMLDSVRISTEDERVLENLRSALLSARTGEDWDSIAKILQPSYVSNMHWQRLKDNLRDGGFLDAESLIKEHEAAWEEVVQLAHSAEVKQSFESVLEGVDLNVRPSVEQVNPFIDAEENVVYFIHQVLEDFEEMLFSARPYLNIVGMIKVMYGVPKSNHCYAGEIPLKLRAYSGLKASNMHNVKLTPEEEDVAVVLYAEGLTAEEAAKTARALQTPNQKGA